MRFDSGTRLQMDDVGVQVAPAHLKLPDGTRGIRGQLTSRDLLGIAQNPWQRCRGEPGDPDLPPLRSPLLVVPAELPGMIGLELSRSCLGSWLLISTKDSPTAMASNCSKSHGCLSSLPMSRTSIQAPRPINPDDLVDPSIAHSFRSASMCQGESHATLPTSGNRRGFRCAGRAPVFAMCCWPQLGISPATRCE